MDFLCLQNKNSEKAHITNIPLQVSSHDDSTEVQNDYSSLPAQNAMKVAFLCAGPGRENCCWRSTRAARRAGGKAASYSIAGPYKKNCCWHAPSQNVYHRSSFRSFSLIHPILRNGSAISCVSTAGSTKQIRISPAQSQAVIAAFAPFATSLTHPV